MKQLYPFTGVKAIIASVKKTTFIVALSFAGITAFSQSTSIPELVFKNGTLKTAANTDKKDGAIYRFANVATGIDAEVKINSRSSSNVVLTDLDINNTGYDNAFQPLVNYTGGGNYSASKVTDWYMEFQVSFFEAGNQNPKTVDGFDVTALDIDGNTDLHEYVSFYAMSTYTLENPTSLTVTTLTSGSTNIGKRFDGGTTEHDGIDPAVTQTQVTNHYLSTSSFAVRVGGKARGPISIGSGGRQNSLWFKAFTFLAPVQSSLPLTLVDFTGLLNDKKVMLNWATAMEVNTSHFVVQRSLDGKTFEDAGIVFAEGNSSVRKNYEFPDNIATVTGSLIYYRLKMVDMDTKFRLSPIIVVRLLDNSQLVNILVYPNPTVNEIRITIPNDWQSKTIAYSVYNTSGNLVKQKITSNAGQTESLYVADLPVGLYIIKALNGDQSAVQRFVKVN